MEIERFNLLCTHYEIMHVLVCVVAESRCVESTLAGGNWQAMSLWTKKEASWNK
jgi:hypothetical protein